MAVHADMPAVKSINSVTVFSVFHFFIVPLSTKTSIMSNNCFKFKRFTVSHSLCAMKVGTDGVLLGAWANGGERILDIGTGSGLIALFMAQRNGQSAVTAIDIEHDACVQAEENVRLSPFSERIRVIESSLQDFHAGKYDSIVCNPPFFNDSLKSKSLKRTVARHTDTLSYMDLLRGAYSLLETNGEFSAIIPSSCHGHFDTEALMCGFYPSRVCAIRTLPGKPVSRYLLAYRKSAPDVLEASSGCINNEDMTRSDWYKLLTEDFYL